MTATPAVPLQTCQEEERTRIARELHDGLLQDVLAITLQLQAVLPGVRAASEAAAQALLPIIELAEKATVEARRDIMGMRAIADDESLVAAIERIVRRSTAHTPVMVSTAVFGRVRSVPSDLQETIVRIVREAATNVARHARARRVRLTVAFGGRQLRVTIDDDGKGFDTSRAASEEQLGLIGMHERASAVGGSLAIRSCRGGGTTVTLDVPWRSIKAA